MGRETQNFVFLVIDFRGCALEADDGLGVGFSVGPLATPSAIFIQLKKTQLEDKETRQKRETCQRRTQMPLLTQDLKENVSRLLVFEKTDY